MGGQAEKGTQLSSTIVIKIVLRRQLQYNETHAAR